VEATVNAVSATKRRVFVDLIRIIVRGRKSFVDAS